MKRRIFLLCVVLGLLALSSLLVAPLKALALTATLSKTPTPSPFPQANFSATPLSGTEPLTVQFTHLYTSTSSPILSCSWTFGDGTSHFVSGSFTTCPSVSHVYPAGIFTVQLSVTITDIVITATKTNYIQVQPVGGWTPTRTRTPGCGGVIVVTSTFTPTASPTPPTGPTPTRTATSCGATFITATPDSPTLTPTPTPQGDLPDLVISDIYWSPSNPQLGQSSVTFTAVIRNNGTAASPAGVIHGVRLTIYANQAGPVNRTSTTHTQSIPPGGTATVQFSPVWTPTIGANYTISGTVDFDQLIVETNDSNNSYTDPTQINLSPPVTRTPTRTNTPSATSTSRTPTPVLYTPTPTPSFTPTAGTPTTGGCSPVTSMITIPFIFDGAGAFCWQASSLGGFINSWNTNSVRVNGVNFTNVYVPASSYPAKINSFYYVGYDSSVAWGHFEAKP